MAQRYVLAAAIGAVVAVTALGVFVAGAARVMAPDPAPSPPVAAPVLAQGEGYAVWDRQPDGSPVRWNPCEPVPWVLDARNAPDRAREALTLAMSRITTASGIEFTYLGGTTEAPSRDRSLVVDGPDGLAWAPVLITWVPGDSIDLPLSDSERGVTVPVAVEQDGARVFVTGQVVLNADKSLLPMFEDRHASWGAVLLHELGHLVGLDHVDDPVQLMAPTPGFGDVVLGDGDLAGLAAVGAAGGCLPEPEPRDLDVTYD